jgi:hypothetical protein
MQYMESDINMDIIIIGEYISAGYISDPISFDNGSTPEPSNYGGDDIADVVFGDVVAVQDGDTVLFVDPISGDVVDVIVDVDAPSVPVIGGMAAVKDGGDVIAAPWHMIWHRGVSRATGFASQPLRAPPPGYRSQPPPRVLLPI